MKDKPTLTVSLSHKKWWHKFSPKHRKELKRTQAIANFIVQKRSDEILEKAMIYTKEALAYGRTPRP